MHVVLEQVVPSELRALFPSVSDRTAPWGLPWAVVGVGATFRIVYVRVRAQHFFAWASTGAVLFLLRYECVILGRYF